MKTKHLLYSLAIVGAFSACTNEDLLSEGQNTSSLSKRPVVKNVTLNVKDNADTRMEYAGGYKFQDGDKMAALLMDENISSITNVTDPDEWNELTWLEKYGLTDYVHTNYPFIYDEAKDEWKTDANMLEGNYFITYPYVTFNGNRKAYYDITNQAQIGNNGEARKKAIAENQFFIGYTKLDAQEGDASAVKAQLHPVLCPLRIQLESHLDHTVQVTKIVLHHPDLYSQITLDPTDAKYTGKKEGEGIESKKAKWNLTESNDFNYANYLATAWGTQFDGTDYTKELYTNGRYGSTIAKDYVYNIAEGDAGVAEGGVEHVAGRYYANDALRAIVKPLKESNSTEYANTYAQLYLKDSDESNAMTLEMEKMIKGIIMVPSFEATEAEPLMLTIYTNEGIIGDINISEANADGTNQNVQTLGEIKKATPETPFTTNTVTVVLNAGSITRIPTELVVDETGDLEKYVDYIALSDQNQTYTAKINNDVVVTDELAAKILGLKRSSLKFVQLGKSGNNLKFATTAKALEAGKTTADVLDKLEIAFSKEEKPAGVRIEIMEGATLNLSQESRNKDKDDLLFAVSGTLNIVGENTVYGGYNESGAAVDNYSEVTVNVRESGKVNVEANKTVGIKFVNNGTIDVKAGKELYVAPNTVNHIKGIVDVNGMLSGTANKNFKNLGTINNYGKLYNIVNSEAAKKNIKPGYIYVREGATRTGLSENSGVIVYDVLTPVVKESEDGNFKGQFAYTGAGVAVEKLSDAFVNEATITSGQLTVVTIENFTLNKLVVKNATVISGATPKTQQTLNVVNLELENANVDDIKFANMSAESPALLRGEITFNANVEFTGDLLLNKANVTNAENATLTGKNMEAVKGINSNFINDGTVINLEVNKDNISVSGKAWTNKEK